MAQYNLITQSAIYQLGRNLQTGAPMYSKSAIWPKGTKTIYAAGEAITGQPNSDRYVKIDGSPGYLPLSILQQENIINKKPTASMSNADGSTSKDILTGITVSSARLKKIDTVSYVVGTALWIGGFVLAYNRKSGFWGYVGWSMLGSFVGAAAGRAAGYALTKDK